MRARSPFVALLAACLIAAAPASAYTLGRANFTSAGGGPGGSPIVLGTSVGLPVAGGPSLALSPNGDESVGFWRWGHVLTLGVRDPQPVVLAWGLSPAAPNPFHALTQIRYAIPGSAGEVGVQLRIFDLSGRVVRTLDSGARAPGVHTLTWDGRDDDGHVLGGGVYFCRVTAGTYAATRRLVLAR